MYLGVKTCESCKSLEKRCSKHQGGIVMKGGCSDCYNVMKRCKKHQRSLAKRLDPNMGKRL